MSGDLAALMAVRIQGIASVNRTADLLYVDEREAQARLQALMEAELVRYRDGKLPGHLLLPDGARVLEELLEQEGLRGSEEFRECYDRFMVADRLVKAACMASESDFEQGLDRLISGQDKIRVAVRKLVRCADRYEAYRLRLEGCMTRLMEGDRPSFCRPQAESYHQVWWEMHTDLATTLAIEKEV